MLPRKARRDCRHCRGCAQKADGYQGVREPRKGFSAVADYGERQGEASPCIRRWQVPGAWL
nr:MAG TPA: hypothetical protein [Caudoviricetes sp.]